MEKNNNQEMERATTWLKRRVSEIGHGEIGVNFVIHQGEICKTEFKIVEKKTALGQIEKPTRVRFEKEPIQSIRNPESQKNPKLIRVGDVARILGLHPGSVRRWVSQGKIPYIKIGSAVRFERDEIMKRFVKKYG